MVRHREIGITAKQWEQLFHDYRLTSDKRKNLHYNVREVIREMLDQVGRFFSEATIRARNRRVFWYPCESVLHRRSGPGRSTGRDEWTIKQIVTQIEEWERNLKIIKQSVLEYQEQYLR